MANKVTLLKRLVKLINDNSEITNDEKIRLSNEAEKLTKVEIQNAIDEYRTKTSSSNEPNIEQIKDGIHQKITDAKLDENVKKGMHEALEKLDVKEILQMGVQKEKIDAYIEIAIKTVEKGVKELENLEKPKKSKKSSKKPQEEKDEEADQVLEDHKGSYILDPKGENIVVRVRQREACRIFQVKKSKGSVTVICGEQKLVIPRKDQHVLYLDGALSLN